MPQPPHSTTEHTVMVYAPDDDTRRVLVDGIYGCTDAAEAEGFALAVVADVAKWPPELLRTRIVSVKQIDDIEDQSNDTRS